MIFHFPMYEYIADFRTIGLYRRIDVLAERYSLKMWTNCKVLQKRVGSFQQNNFAEFVQGDEM